MQLILDADDIDIKRNMSTIEHESHSEKFHSNNIVEHLAEDMSNGNKENIQKQNNIILEKSVDEDNSDSDKDSNKELSSNINGESPKEDSNVEDENRKILKEEENEISNSEVQVNPDCESHSIENKENEKCPVENSEANLAEQKEDGEQKADEKKGEDEELKEVEKLESDKKQEKHTAIDGFLTVENTNKAEATTDSNNDVKIMLNKSDIIVDDDLVKETRENEEPCPKQKINDNLSEYSNESTDLVTNSNSSQNTVSIDVADEDMKTPKTVCSEIVGVEVEDVKTISNSSEKNTLSDTADAEEKTNSNCDEANTSIEIIDEDVKTTNSECSEKDISNETIDENAPSNKDVDVSTKVDENNCDSEKDVAEVTEKMDVNDESNIDIPPTPKSPTLPQVDVITEKEKGDNLEPKRFCRLSNNLEIFSDEEDDSSGKHPNEPEPPEDNTEPSTEKQCISLDDDDDIMVIDEDPNTNDIKNVTDNENNSEKIEPDNIEPCPEDQPTNKEELIDTPEPIEAVKDSTAVPKETRDNVEPSNDATEKPSIVEPEPIVDEVVESQSQIKKKPLLPKNFIKSYKKNLADMTRDELEEFCILKIVESIVDRSNLGEIKSQLKNLTQTMEECKKKCLMLSKQNKDLQVILKSVQEDQKSGSDNHITPLKITRSVGMQVVMVADKSNMRKRQVNGVGSPAPGGNNSANNKSVKSPITPNTKTPKEKNTNNQQIPVPRLVPAVPAAKASQMSTVNNSPKQINTIASPNGLRPAPPPPPPKAAEKRPRSQSQSITVDLTDDEPPAKQQTVQRTYMNQTVRFAGNQPPSNIMTAQRLGTNINSPRKVYIPISGAQAQNVRPGQPIMLKAVSGLPPRQRFPGPNAAKVPQAGPPMRLTKLHQIRHPAPLPEAAKQYQPSNWKSLPPAPDLKLSKVENGIVISWKIDNYQEDNHEQIASYQLYAYQETQSPPNTSLWKKIGDVKALPLPMACTLTQFMAGYKYYFAVRAVDVKSRFGPFSLPGSILLLNKL